MTIPTQMSLHGYIATAPELSFTDTGHARFYCRVGIEQHRKEVDGSFTRLDPVYADLVMFDRTAERKARLRGNTPGTYDHATSFPVPVAPPPGYDRAAFESVAADVEAL